ncbi:MAG: hypothetical protein LBV40_02790 [Methanomicrobiales archaeon]|jgi:hypothetical protein|nr:hypothetical protein [Methanomicrobiales archaeon]
MTKIRAQAVEILQDIPDDKMVIVIEILKGLRSLYSQNEKPATHREINSHAMGIFNKYANKDLLPVEKKAWGEAVKEKHAF